MKEEDVKEGARVVCVWQGHGKAYFGKRGTITKINTYGGKLSSYWVADDNGKWISEVGWGYPESFDLDRPRSKTQRNGVGFRLTERVLGQRFQ